MIQHDAHNQNSVFGAINNDEFAYRDFQVLKLFDLASFGHSDNFSNILDYMGLFWLFAPKVYRQLFDSNDTVYLMEPVTLKTYPVTHFDVALILSNAFCRANTLLLQLDPKEQEIQSFLGQFSDMSPEDQVGELLVRLQRVLGITKPSQIGADGYIKKQVSLPQTPEINELQDLQQLDVDQNMLQEEKKTALLQKRAQSGDVVTPLMMDKENLNPLL